MNKRLVRVLVYYGNFDGEEVKQEFVINDSKEARKDILDEYGGFYEENTEEFLEMQSDYFDSDLGGGDWDEPTSRTIIIYDKEEILADLTEEYESDVRGINSLFKEDVVYG